LPRGFRKYVESDLVSFNLAQFLQASCPGFWVGTIRVADVSFTAVDQQLCRSFGQSRDAATDLNTDRRFTGQTEDLSSGLSWYAWRA
jgi:hypothetical protein